MKFKWDFSEFYEFADRLDDLSRLEKSMANATKRLAKELLRLMKEHTPIGDTHKLINGWNGNNFAVKKVKNGFQVLIVNTDEKAAWVNDGHRSFNQFNVGTNAPYEVHNRKKVLSPYKWQLGDGVHWVYGQFFVERGILRLTNTKEIEQIIMDELEKWWEGCLNG